MGSRTRKSKTAAINYQTAPEDRETLQKRIEIDSRVESDVGKRAMAEALTCAIIHLRILMKLEMAGELGSEECRSIPGTISTIRRLCDSLGLVDLMEEGMEDLGEFFRDHQVYLVASLPCYLEENVDAQRGDGVFKDSIRAIQVLNDLGYGREPHLKLDLVYNPVGPHLPPPEASLEQDYHRELGERFGISFTRLFTITNMPIGQFRATLKRQKQFDEYFDLLRNSFNPETVTSVMCRNQISVDWDGRLYDCDFNLALKMPVGGTVPHHIRDFDPAVHGRRQIETADHCYGCTAGAGSSCGGALV